VPLRATVHAAGLALLALGLAACTTPLALSPAAGPPDFGYRGGEGRRVFVVTPFADERPPQPCDPVDPAELARWPTPREQLRCSDDPLRWFAERLAAALGAAGYTVVGEAPADREEILEIRGALRALEVEAVTKVASGLYEADVGIELHVTSPSGLNARRRFYVKDAHAAGTRQDALDSSARRAVRDMTAAFLTLTNRYPGVGVAVATP
jgi:hypothetical protein